MLASRALLAKQAAAMLVRQPACLMHHGGDWGNWGNTNIAVVFSGCGWVRFKISFPISLFCSFISKTIEGSLKQAPFMVTLYNKVSFVNKLIMTNIFQQYLLTFHHVPLEPCKLNNDVERIMKEFHRSRKPIGLSSMAPLLACRVLPNLEVTMGYERDESSRWGRWPNTTMVQAVKSMGAYVDEKNKVISTPTFMWETDYHYHYIFDGIGNMVKHVMRMTAK
uniref:Es1 protein n=1 Tax=Sinocyclocheilus grahami TaxID=75366 RepID=A0A672LL57_SINGR